MPTGGVTTKPKSSDGSGLLYSCTCDLGHIVTCHDTLSCELQSLFQDP